MTASHSGPNRRDFLRGAGLTAAAVAATPKLAGAKPIFGSPTSILFSPYERATWERLAGSTVRIAAPSGAVDATVGDTTGYAPARPGGECFTAAFVAPAAAVLPEETYVMTHPMLGSFRLHLTAGPVTRTTRTYRALVNRL